MQEAAEKQSEKAETVIARSVATKQSSGLRVSSDCGEERCDEASAACEIALERFATVFMTVHGLLRSARNDGQAVPPA